MSAVDDIIQVVMTYQVGSSFYQNSYGFRVDVGTVGPTDLLTDLATWTDINGQTFLASFMYGKGSGAVLKEYKAVDVKPGTAAPTAIAATVAGGEGAATELLPPQASCVATFRTALKGRAYRGREYEGGKLEADQAAGVWTAATLANSSRHLTLLMTRFGPAHSNTNFTWGVISRYLNLVKRPTPVITPITSYTQRSTVFNQRRRTLGIGT